MKEFFIVLVVVIIVIRGLAKLGGATSKGDAPRPRPRKQATRPPKNTHVSRGASHKSASATAKPGKAVPPKIRRPIFGRRKTPATPSTAAPPPTQGPGSDTYVRYLIDVLRVGEPAASRQAVERLVELGKPALPVLQSAARDPSPFVRERVQQASRRILEAVAEAGSAMPTLEEEPIALSTPPPIPTRETRPALFEKREPRPTPGTRPSARPPAPPADEPPPEPNTPTELPERDAPVDAEPASATPESAESSESTESSESAESPVDLVDVSDIEAVARVLKEAAAAPGFGGRRDEILEPLKFAEARFTVVALRVQWTGSFGVSEAYRSGRTVGGTMQEVDLPVAVCLPAARNADADALTEGDTFAFRGVFVSWDGMYDRGKFEGDLLEEPAAQE